MSRKAKHQRPCTKQRRREPEGRALGASGGWQWRKRSNWRPRTPFDSPTAGGGRVSLADLKGRRVVVYFYPKDDTPGCTQEALSFTEKAKAFAAAKAVVVGISRDTVAKHEKFTAKHDLTDPRLRRGRRGLRFTASGLKKTLRMQVWRMSYATFLIDAKGKIAQIRRKVHARTCGRSLERG
ncbi:MAG: peroxiredoxin [Hyphomonadaceae bacterium]